MNLFQILSLHERRLGRVRVDAQTVGLVLFARFAGLLVSGLFGLELFLDRRLIDFFMLLLSGDKDADLALQVRSNLLCELGMVSCLSVGLESDGVDRVTQFPVEVDQKAKGGRIERTYPISSLPIAILASFASRLA